jgi:hypothetical protein
MLQRGFYKEKGMEEADIERFKKTGKPMKPEIPFPKWFLGETEQKR